jgi:general secretion pathway protein E/type IV pilus assembly protein PilB
MNKKSPRNHNKAKIKKSREVLFMDYVNLVEKALMENASDIHFIPKKENVECYFREKGRLTLHENLENSMYQVILQKVKALAHMNISEKRMPQDGVITKDGKSIRVSTLNALQGESLVLRLFSRELISYEDLGLSKVIETQLLKSVQESYGITLISGETGMGKSTTMYALMMKLRDLNYKVISIEDPCEREVEGIIQTQINEMKGLTYDKAIFAALRQDPDYICIGEIRNEETAKAVVRASLTGHRVISTIHGRHYDSVIERMLDFGVGKDYLHLSLVLYQKLKMSREGKKLYGFLENENTQANTADLGQVQKNKVFKGKVLL